MKLLFLASLTFCLSIGLNAQWQKLDDLPGNGRHHPVYFAIDDKGYVLAGNNNTRQSPEPYLKDMYEFDAVTGNWTQLDDFPGDARGFGIGLAYEGKGYVGFGVSTERDLDDLWEYDPTSKKWKQLASCPCDGRAHPAFVAAQGKLYVGLGSSDKNLKDWWEYDIDSNRWTQMPDLPGPPRHHPFFFSVDGIAYAGLGHGNGQIPESIYKDWYAFDPSTRQWTQKADFVGGNRVAGTHFFTW